VSAVDARGNGDLMGAYFIPRTEYPALELFLPIYIETFVGDRYDDEWAAARAFVAEEKELGPRLSTDIQAILSSGATGSATEEEIAVWFASFGAEACDPRPYGYGYREWMTEIMRVAADPSHNPSQGSLPSD
jgi:hypothetical protein